MKVRDNLPKRRPVPTNSPKGKNWSQHKGDLQVDFHFHCAYCGSFDGFRHTYFEVDHFVPKSLFEKSNNIDYCQYDNLVYSCKFCNNYKLSKWPTNNEAIHNTGSAGFVDPCSKDFDNHLYRAKNGGILWNTDLGEWMAIEAFRFDIRERGIKLLFELNQRRKLIEDFAEELAKMNSASDDYKLAKAKAGDISLEYVLLHKELMDYYNNI